MNMKKLSILIVIAFVTVFMPLNGAICAEAEPAPAESSVEPASPDETSDSEAAVEGAGAAMGARGPIDSGSVGKGASLSPLLSESFQTDLATGSATVNVPIVVPPGRKNMQPNLALSYSSNNANGVCGVGWALTSSSIQRSTKRGAPKYDNTDTFVFSSSGSSGELVSIGGNEYRQKIETAFMKYVFDGTSWSVWDKNGTKYTFGTSSGSRIENAAKVFAWFLDTVEDVHGNSVSYAYEKDSYQIYLSRVDYTAGAGLSADKSVEFIYDKIGRTDIMYNNRSGWEIATKWLLERVDIKVDTNLKWKYVLTHTSSVDTSRSLLTEVKLEDSLGNTLPAKKFTYQTIN